MLVYRTNRDNERVEVHFFHSVVHPRRHDEKSPCVFYRNVVEDVLFGSVVVVQDTGRFSRPINVRDPRLQVNMTFWHRQVTRTFILPENAGVLLEYANAVICGHLGVRAMYLHFDRRRPGGSSALYQARDMNVGDD